MMKRENIPFRYPSRRPSVLYLHQGGLGLLSTDVNADRNAQGVEKYAI